MLFRSKIPKLYETEDTPDPTIFVKLFISNFSWYITEISIDDDTCFGYVVGLDSELGYFSLEEIKALKGTFGRVERDISFKPTLLSIIKASYEQ